MRIALTECLSAIFLDKAFKMKALSKKADQLQSVSRSEVGGGVGVVG